MTLLRTVQHATEAARTHIIDNIEKRREKTGTTNQYGDQTLVLDLDTENLVMDVLGTADTDFAFLTEEQGLITGDRSPEYLAIIDPIDGSVNLERGVPLCSVGIAVLPYGDIMTSDDIEVSVIASVFTDEVYVAERGHGVMLNGRRVRPSDTKDPTEAIVSYDTHRNMSGEFGQRSLSVLAGVGDIRRTGTNLLDLCWTAAGKLDAMVDLRDILAVIHVSGTHMVSEAGGHVIDGHGNRFVVPIEAGRRMSYVAASNRGLAERLLDLFNT